MNNIMMYRLVTGEFVVSETDETTEAFEMTNPIVLIPSQQGIGMSPLLAYSNRDSVTIKKEHILFETTPSADIEAEYRRIFSGLIVPSSTLVN